jgi:hypothetical protein
VGAREYEVRLRAVLAQSNEELYDLGASPAFHGDMNRAKLDEISHQMGRWSSGTVSRHREYQGVKLFGIGTKRSAEFDQPGVDPAHADFSSGIIIHETTLFSGIENCAYLFPPAKVQRGLIDIAR